MNTRHREKKEGDEEEKPLSENDSDDDGDDGGDVQKNEKYKIGADASKKGQQKKKRRKQVRKACLNCKISHVAYVILLSVNLL